MNCKILSWLGMGLAFLPMLFSPVNAEDAVMALPLESAIKLPDVCVKEIQKSETRQFSAMPQKKGYIPVMRVRMYSYADTTGGCNYNAQIEVNGQFLTRYTVDAKERLIGRNATFGLLHYTDNIVEFPIFAGNNLMMIFGPTAEAADGETADHMGATFLFDLSDRVRGVDGNSVTFRNIRGAGAPRPDLVVQKITVGYLALKNLPKEKTLAARRGTIAQGVRSGNLELHQGAMGGFTVRDNRSKLTLAVETHWGMTPETPVIFRSEDQGQKSAGVRFAVKKIKDGFALNGSWENGLKLHRTLQLSGGRLQWQERWRNDGKAAVGVPFRHRSWIQSSDMKVYVGGDCDTGSKPSAGHNPTLFLEDKASGNGFGLIAENDWARLLISLRAADGVTELYSNQLGLAPGKEITLEYSIDAEGAGQGYWGFINRLRKRWLGEKTLTAPCPYFCNTFYEKAPGANNVEKIRNSYAHLGPIAVSYTDWSRLIPDVHAIHEGRIPKRADGTPDIEAFLTLKHREVGYQKFAQALKDFAEGAPEAKLIMITHPAMEIVYRPEADKWPYAADEIKTKEGGCFNDEYYSRAYLYGQVDNGWAIYYYVPSAGSAYLNVLKENVRRYMEEMKAPGIYFDEFSFNHVTRGYCRYNYGKSDGYSADLDANGNVVCFKSDNAMASLAAQKELVDIVIQNHGTFYANTGPVLTTLQRNPVLYFTEGGNGLGCLGEAHLTQVPMALGNFGDDKTVKGIFDATKAALSAGTIFSPHGGNMLLSGRDNFVCKLYPITIQELGAGVIRGKERLITTRGGKLAWNVPDGAVTLYCYNQDGVLQKPLRKSAVKKGVITLEVPQSGMVIAELDNVR